MDVSQCSVEPFLRGRLSVTVLGASGDLAKKKTYPSLFDLHRHFFLPKKVAIVGYARSATSNEDFRAKLRPFLLDSCKENPKDEAAVDAFLAQCTYFKGAYDNAADFARLAGFLTTEEGKMSPAEPNTTNRLFYFAIPPDAFLSSSQSIKKSAMSPSGFTRLIVEKPFGHDLASAQKLSGDLGAVFTEDYIYRIDHYLGKEIVQNLQMFRFGNAFLDPIWNNKYIAAIKIVFAEPFGTEGRGGYFTNYGIIRDVMQNHLMQVLSIVAMEAPPSLVGPEAGNLIRDAKVKVLKSISPLDPNQVVCGQYTADGGKPGYLDDDSIKDKEKAKYVCTFAQVVLNVCTPRWEGVPFIMKAGKALNNKKVEIRVQFKDAPAASFLFAGEQVNRNEMVMRLQPDELVYMKVNLKEPGLSHKAIQSELDLTYKKRYEGLYNPEAYTRLILEALRGNQENFVRTDELITSWKLFTPLLEALEGPGRKLPLPYKYSSRGPAAADEMAHRLGFLRQEGYVWK